MSPPFCTQPLHPPHVVTNPSSIQFPTRAPPRPAESRDLSGDPPQSPGAHQQIRPPNSLGHALLHSSSPAQLRRRRRPPHSRRRGIDCARGRGRRPHRPRPGHAAAGSPFPSSLASPDARPLPSQGLPLRANMELFGG
ncbi:hypothetical protein VPH35_087571 [Triticum aestivum]